MWLRRTGRRSAFAWVPMVFVMTITVWSLVVQVRGGGPRAAASGLRLDTPTLNGVVCVLLLVLVARPRARGGARGPRAGGEPAVLE